MAPTHNELVAIALDLVRIFTVGMGLAAIVAIVRWDMNRGQMAVGLSLASGIGVLVLTILWAFWMPDDMDRTVSRFVLNIGMAGTFYSVARLFHSLGHDCEPWDGKAERRKRDGDDGEAERRRGA